MSKRILHISNKPIYPLVDGGCVAMHQFCQSLFKIKDWSIYHLCISTHKHCYQESAYKHANHKFVAHDHVQVDTSVYFLNAIRTSIKGESYNLSRFQSEALIDKINSWIVQHDIDCIVFDSLYAAAVTAKHSFSVPFYIRTHNVEANIWLEKESKNPIKKMVFRFLGKKLAPLELNILNRSNGVFFISENDKKHFNNKLIGKKSTVLPVGVETIYNPTKYHPHRFHFIGAMNWHPNQEAVHLLLKEIFPIIRKENPLAELHLAGSYFPDDIKTIESQKIFVHGFVNDPTAFRKTHGTQIMPIQSGSGVRIKLIEALAEGIPIVASPSAVLGMNEDIKDCCIIRNTSKEIAEAALKLNENSELRDQLTKKGYSFVEHHFSIDSIAQKIVSFVHT